MPRQRRDRETAQEEQESTEQQQVGRTPQNQAKAGTRRGKSAGKDSAVATSAAENSNNPLKKVVFVHHVLRFLKQGYVDSDIESDNDESSGAVKKLIPVPRFIHLRHVSSCWKETVEFYNPQPQENAFTFCRHFSKLVERGKKMKFPSVQGSIVLRDIVGWLSNVEIKIVSVGESDSDDESDDDESDDTFVCDILLYFRRCLRSSTWKEEQSGFELHAAFIRDTLLWISKFGVFKRDEFVGEWDDLRVWCEIVDLVITMNKTEYFGFDTPEMRDALLSLSKHITTSNSIHRIEAVSTWFELVSTLTRDNEKMQKIFGTKEVLDEFIRLSDVLKQFTREDYCVYYGDEIDGDEIEKYCSSMFKALSAITELETNANIFATVEFRDTIASLFREGREVKLADTEYFLKLLHNLISTNKSNKKLFAVESVRDVMLLNYGKNEYFDERSGFESIDLRHRRWTKHIKDNESACLFFENLLALFEVKPKLFLIDETRKNFVEFARRIVEDGFNASSATIRIFLTALLTMLDHNEKLFFSERIDKFLIKTKTEKKLLQEEESTKLFFSEIEEIYEKMKKPVEKQEKEKNEQRNKKWKENVERQEQYWKNKRIYLEIADEVLEDLAGGEYWEEKGELLNWNCYYRESEEEKRTRYEEDAYNGVREWWKKKEMIAFFESHCHDDDEDDDEDDENK